MATMTAPITKVLDKVRASRQRAVEQAQTSYKDLVAAVAIQDHSPTEQEIESLVDDLEQFALDIERRKERQRLAAILSTEPAIKEEREKLHGEMTAARDDFDVFAKQHEDSQKARLHRLNAIDAQRRECDGARKQLRETAAPNSRETELTERLKSLCAEQRELAEQLDPHSSTKNVAVFLGQCELEQRPRVQQRYNLTKSRHAAVQEEIAQLQAERDELDSIKLFP